MAHRSAPILLVLAVLLLPSVGRARCAEPKGLLDPRRSPLPAAQLDALQPGATVAEIFAALGPAQSGGSAVCGRGHRCLEWQFDDRRGLAVEIDRFCSAPLVMRRETTHSARQAEVAARAGLWMVPHQQVEALDERARALGLPGNYGDPDAFYFDGKTLNLGLFPFFSDQAMNPNRPPDDVYRVATKWIGEDLYMLSPQNPTWFLQAHFRNGHFETTVPQRSKNRQLVLLLSDQGGRAWPARAQREGQTIFIGAERHVTSRARS